MEDGCCYPVIAVVIASCIMPSFDEVRYGTMESFTSQTHTTATKARMLQSILSRKKRGIFMIHMPCISSWCVNGKKVVGMIWLK